MKPSLVIAVGLGGAVGSMLRFVFSFLIQKVSPLGVFPLATVVINFSGSIAIGCLATYLESRGRLGSLVSVFLLVGLLGGFTTFSSFSYETILLWNSSRHLQAFANIAVSVCLGCAGVCFGMYLGKQF